MNKKLLVVAIIVALGAVVAAGFYYLHKPTSTTNTSNTTKPFAVEKKDLPLTELPKGFPKELPAEKGATILSNYQAVTTDGRVQSTRVLTTKQTLEQVRNVYREFFKANGWAEVSVQTTDANTYTASLRKKDDVVMIVARNNTATKERTVEISLTQAPINK
jgi:hypothetical protein